MSVKLELATFGLENFSLVNALDIERIELCSNRQADGLTPDADCFRVYRSVQDLDIRVMIRAKAGDFTCNDAEFENMKQALLAFKKMGANGFVFGILQADKTIDIDRNKELVELAYPLPCTFHKAFDQVQDAELALEQCIAIGFKNILSSGLEANVFLGIDTLKSLTKLANGRIELIPGGGIRALNLHKIDVQLRSAVYHTAAILDDGNKADEEELKAILNLLN
jgi:copper homeostasis protein